MNYRILITCFVLLGLSINLFSQTYLISSGGTVNTCAGTFYDSGGSAGSYQNGENYTMTICSNLPGAHIMVNFTAFQLETGWDYLSIYDGPNTGSPALVTNGSGTTLNGMSYTSTGTCLTFRFTSDGSVTYTGWAATVSCSFPCQDYSIAITGSTPPVTNSDSLWIDVCQGQTIQFTAGGTFPNSGVNYVQTNANLTWTWSIVNGGNQENFSGVGMNTLTYTFNNSGGYHINLTATDLVGCGEMITQAYRVRVSIDPVFTGSYILENNVCPNEIVHLYGVVTPVPWEEEFQDEVAGVTFLPDGSGVHYQTSITNGTFQPGAVVSSISDILSICVNMEHTYMGDLDMEIECPNGQTMTIFEQGGNGTILGQPVGTDLPIDGSSSNTSPGIGFDYCWSPTSTSGPIDQSTNWTYLSTYTDPQGHVSSGVYQLNPGTYQIDGNWSDLIGCPLNGSWTIHITDNLGLDNGYIFSWQLHFAANLIPANLWNITNTYDMNDAVWTGNGVQPGNGANAIAYPTVSGSQGYTFTVIDDFGCSYDTTIYITVLQPNDPSCCVMPSPNAGPDELVCTNTYTFNPEYTAGNTFNWTQVSGPGTSTWANQTSPNATVTVSAYGVYVFRFNEQNMSPACNVGDEVQISFWPVPQSTFAASTVLCAGDISTITYTGNATAAASYAWDFAGGTIQDGSGQGPYHIIWTDSGNHTMSLQVTEHTCVSEVTTVTLYTPPVLDANPTVVDDPCYQMCNGSATLNVLGGTPPYEYHWGSSSNFLDHLCAGDYIATVNDANDCESVVSFTIAEPTELVKDDTTYQNLSCYMANDGMMSITVSGGVPPYDYIWIDNGPNSPVRNGMAAGNYSVTVEDANGCSLFEMFQLTQPAELQVMLSPSMSICEGQNVMVNAQAMGGTLQYHYFWNTGNGFIEGPAVLSVTPDTTTTYTVYVVDQHDCMSNVETMTITVSPLLQITNVDLTHNRCYHSCDGRAELTVVGGIPPLTYSWGSPIHIFNDLCAGIYTVTVTDRIGCFAFTHFVITEPDTLNYSVQTTPALCHDSASGTAAVVITGGTIPYSYVWPNNETTSSVSMAAGNYVMTVTDAHSCRIEVPFAITEPAPVVVQPWPDPLICIGETATVAAQAGGGMPYYNFAWTGSDGSTSNLHLFHVSPDTTTTYTVTVTDDNGCLGNIATVTVNVHPPITIGSVTTSTDTVCQGENAIVFVDVQGGNGGPYVITLQDGTIVGSPFTVRPVFTQTFYVEATDMCGSPSVHDSITITVIPYPENEFVSDVVETCAPGLIQFSEITEVEGNSYYWNFGDGNFADIKNPIHLYQDQGTYTVSLTVSTPYGCETSRTISNMITVYPKPSASFVLEPEIATMLDSEIKFTNYSQYAMRYYWYFGDGDSSLFVHPRHMYVFPGEFEVMLIAVSEHNCKDTTRRTVIIENLITIYAPDSFTPNGDGINDCFRLCGNGIDPNVFNLSVYDRWGNRVYYTEYFNPEVGCNGCSAGAWDGTDNGNRQAGDKYLPVGLYTWYCEFKDLNNITYKKSGVVRLLR